MEYCFRPRRSALYVPGCNQHYLDRARTLPTDAVILDLGDPILIDAKIESRNNVVAAVKKGGYGSREVIVRVNNLDSAEHVHTALKLLDEAGGSHMPIMVMIESPIAVLNAKEIAAASDRIVCMMMATSDLTSQLHARVTHEQTAILTALSLVILAARAYGRCVVDGITSDFKNMHSFEYACRLGRDLGFDGKTLVSPSQIMYSNDAYTPKSSEVAEAREIITALQAANEAGLGTVVVKDKLVEHHHVKAAERLLKLHDMIAELEEEYV
jgi:citrate lyase subunit beta/citryl-CoA lyase